MSQGHGASVVRDGLVFYYDTSNTKKSWKGRPTTNLTRIVSDVSGTQYASENEWTSPVSVLTKTFNSSIITPVGTGATLISESGSNGYHHLSRWGGAEITGDHALSCYVYPLSSGINNFSIGMLGDSARAVFNLNTKTVTSEAGNVAGSSFIRDVPGYPGWLSVGSTINGRAGGWVGAIGLGTDAAYTGTAGGKSLYIAGIQYERLPFATPFTTGTRSTTQAILDLTNNNTVNAVSLTYNSNNTFSFDGTNNYIDCGNSAILDIKRTISLECWFRLSSLSFASSWSNLISKMNSIGDTPTRTYSAFINTGGYIHFCTADSTGQEVLNSTAFIQLNTWYHWVGTIDRYTGSVKQYVNGVENVSGTVRTTDTITNSEPVCINFRGSSAYNRFPGNVDNVKIYNKVLTPLEVRRNFEASRARFRI